MLEIPQALAILADEIAPLATEEIPLSNGVGRRLANPVVSDVDSPPHHKSVMDGYAVRSEDIQDREQRLVVVETILAGGVPQRVIGPGQAARIMTGAPLPEGADCIVMVEKTTALKNDSQQEVIIHESGLAPGHHWMRRGASMQVGDEVFQAGHLIRAHDIGVLAEVGADPLTVFAQPSIAVLATGSELVDANCLPQPGQVRNSNGPMLTALASRLSSQVKSLPAAPDEPRVLRSLIEQGLESDLLLMSGGVSAGLADHVPATLHELGVREIFHGVAIKPGKPIWFGVREHSGRRQYVFGLPGNPVSTLVCFEIFVRGGWQRLTGAATANRETAIALLKTDHSVRGPRPSYWPVRVSGDAQGIQHAKPLPWAGSSDLRCLSQANGLAIFPPRDIPYRAGEKVSFLPLD